MGKSSLGKRKTSVCPVRLSSLGTVGEVPERNTRQSRSSVKKSLIPRPSRNRTQSSSPAKDAAKCVSTALRPSRSNSNLQHIGTPMTPMCWLGSIPRTAQSTRSTVFDSRGPGLPSKPVLKDSRPLSDKQFQNASVQKVQSYLLQMGDRDFTPSTSKALSTRSLTLKMFVELTSRLLSHFFPKHIINMSNYADEIPLLTKKLGYPGSVKKSWLITGILLTNLTASQGHITKNRPEFDRLKQVPITSFLISVLCTICYSAHM
ncbi:hypothetical protein Cfor_10902 [Coptotermes formosanus]|uniref:Kinetochore protein NDC80 n=1 Tax=Coptotermes formosanus TaxID=36987 RepID=A0A6L2PVK2_COPFO|nr:hypothetical protein Cfor_10902 [Coptotermes formosanus]